MTAASRGTLTSTSGHPKVSTHHLSRLAYIYIRQSTPKQVSHNRESQLYQRQLSERAKALGWSEERIRVIDTDLAQSGRDSSYRAGFQELVAEVSLGHVGIIFGYEVSRLARNNRDWYHLLDLSAVFDTLIADNDGIYHPRTYNDRLLLGLKGTMSEAELHLLRQRLEAGRLNQVKRGAYRQRLPTGLVRRPDGWVEKDPDVQVQHALELIFTQFEVLGTCRKVRRYCRRENLLIPRRKMTDECRGEVIWKVASDSAIYDILCNPAYAGAFAYGRKQIDPIRHKPGQPASGKIRRPLEQWLHVEQDAYPAYISWEQYLENQERLRQNATTFEENKRKARGAPREGAALLQGLVICGCCGHRMRVSYKTSHRYACAGLSRTVATGYCMSLNGASIDEVVTRAFFDALRPAQLDALDAVLADQRREHARLDQQWQERLNRAHYEARLAARQYQAVNPDNRLVAAELERRWELRLRELTQTEEDYHHFRQRPAVKSLPEGLKQQFSRISETLPDLWPSLTSAQRKELLRSLIDQVILKRDAVDKLEVKIVWVSGHYSVDYARPPVLRQNEMANHEALVERVHQLWQAGFSDDHITAELNQQGFRSARSKKLQLLTVQKIRRRHGWYAVLQRCRDAHEVDGCLTAKGLAAQLGLTSCWVLKRINNGVIDSKYVTRHAQGNVFLIHNDPELIAQLRQSLPKNFKPREVL